MTSGSYNLSMTGYRSGLKGLPQTSKGEEPMQGAWQNHPTGVRLLVHATEHTTAQVQIRSPPAESLSDWDMSQQGGHVGLKGPLPGCRDETMGRGSERDNQEDGHRAGSRKRPCRWQGCSKQEPKCVAQGLGEAGEEVTSVGREKRGSKRLPAESEAWVCFLVTLMTMVCSAIPAQGAAILCGSAQEKSLPSN